MGIAHVCLECGQGLAMVRPQRDPHYGLPLVTCPRCSWACVRRKNPSTRMWHDILRRFTALGFLFAQITLGIVLLVLSVVAVGSLSQGEFRLGRSTTMNGYWFGVIMLLVVLPTLTGTWLTAGFSHLKRHFVFMTWAGLVSVILLIIAISLGLSGDVRGLSSTAYEAMSNYQRGLSGFGEYAPPFFGIMAIMMVFALGGIPLGHLILGLLRVVKKKQWQWRLKRRRLRRSAE